VLGQAEAAGFLAPKPVGFIYGVGAVSAAKLSADGYQLIADLQRADEHELMRRYGEEGARLWRLARGIDRRPVSPERETKSISAETTFERDIGELRPLEQHLWDLTERVSARLKANTLAGSTVTLKLKSADFKTRTRARSLATPTQLAASIFAAGRDLLAHEVGTTRFRLIGIGVSHLEDATSDNFADLIDRRAAEAEHAVDKLREKFGKDAVVKGLALGDD
jgi:DNA polymerase-4